MSDFAETLGRVARSPGLKFFVIGFLILLLLVPLLFVAGLVSEREGRAREVAGEVARTWGGQQQIGGPFLVVPYKVEIERKEGDKTVVERVARDAVFMPEDLTITGNAASEVLTRSIFDVNVYTATLAIEGRFLAPDITQADPAAIEPDWRDAKLVLAFSDVSGLKKATAVTVNGAEELPFEPSPMLPTSNLTGIHVKLAGAPSLTGGGTGPLQPFTFRADLTFAGSGTLDFAPAAHETRVDLTSNWPHPSFMGAFSPDERSVSASGFSAKWLIPHLARSVPQARSPAEIGIRELTPYHFGVSFYDPVDFYALVMRAVKYAVLFLAITFMAVFVLELLSKRRVHAVQYLFVGLAMIFFYVLLLSLSEHTGFALAYTVAAGATGGMLALYAGKVLESARSGYAMAALFAVVYGFLYLVLRLEDYALLAGALLGFAALTAVMFATLGVDWSAGGAPRRAPPGEK